MYVYMCIDRSIYMLAKRFIARIGSWIVGSSKSEVWGLKTQADILR